MAISATFAADFTSFTAAIEKADVKLRGLDTSARFVERGLNRLVDQFSGRKLIQEATLMADAVEKIGGKSKLTEVELQSVGNKAAEAAEKMRKMGVEVPPKLEALALAAQKPKSVFSDTLGVLGKIGPAITAAFSIGAITGFAREVGGFAGQITDLNAQWRIGTSRIQAFNVAGAGVGLTLEGMTSSADQLQKRLGEGEDSVVNSLAELNLNARDLKSLGVDEVMFRIDKALVGVGNQFDRARILADLFGRSGAQIGRLMDGSLREVITTTENTSAIIDEKLIKKADEFDDAWQQAWINFRAAAVTAVGVASDAITKLRSSGLLGTDPSAVLNDLPKLKQLVDAQNKAATPKPFIGPRIGEVNPSIVIGGGIKSVIEESAIEKEMRDWAAKTREAAEATASWARNLQGQFLFDQDNAFFNSVTSDATKKLQALTSRAGTAGILPNLNAGLTSGLIFGPGKVSDSPFGGVLSSLNPQNFLGGIKGGFSNLIKGMTGGGGAGGFLSNLGGSLVGGIGNVLGGALTGGISSLIGLGVKGLGKLFGGLLKTEGKETNRLRDSSLFDFTGISGDKGAAQAKFREMASAAGIASTEVDKLLSTGKIKNFESEFTRMTEKIKSFTADQDADQQRLTAAIEKYGFTIEQLGPALQKQRLDDQAKDLIEDWRVLIGAGVEITDVNNGMSEAINEYLQMAIKLGQEVPNAMRPILEKMAEQGTLTDEAGNAITDLEAAGITFSKTMTEGFDAVVKKLDELITKIGLANVELGALEVPSVSESIWDPSNAGPIVPMASGGRGRVSRPTLFLAGEAGPEDFAFSGGNRRFGSSGGADVAGAIEGLSAQMATMMSLLPTQIRDAVIIGRGRFA